MEKNEYALLNFKRDFSSPEDSEGTQKFQKIIFYKLNKDGTFENGTTIEELLSVAIERLTDLNARFACRENTKAIASIEKALSWLKKRTAKRKGVMHCIFY